MDSTSTTNERLLRLPDVEARTGLRKSAIYARIQVGTFPRGIKLGPRVVAWPLSHIESWIAERIREAQR